MQQETESGFVSWFEPARVCRTCATISAEAGEPLGAPMPLARAVRDALSIMAWNPVSISLVRPRPGMTRLDQVEIVRLSQRIDYPYATTADEGKADTHLSSTARSGHDVPRDACSLAFPRQPLPNHVRNE